MVPWHVTHWMNGAIMVLPREGLRDPADNSVKYDRGYYIGEQHYYLPEDENGEFMRCDAPSESFGDDLETWDIAAGSAGASIHTIRQPGTFVYLSHNLIEAFVYDAKAILEAGGEWNNDLMERVDEPGAGE